MFRIIITNDDGIFGVGLEPLIQEIKDLGKVIVIVPDREQSAASHSLTLKEPVRVWKIKKDTYTLTGTPADCVRYGIINIFHNKVDMVISGINFGANLGQDTFYSGTVGAAREGVLMNIPGCAISLVSDSGKNFDTAAKISRKLINWILNTANADKSVTTKSTRQVSLLNVNIPDLPPDKIKGITITRLGKRTYENKIKTRIDPYGLQYHWLKGKLIDNVNSTPKTDVYAIKHKMISITPLNVDNTDFVQLKKLQKTKLNKICR